MKFVCLQTTCTTKSKQIESKPLTQEQILEKLKQIDTKTLCQPPMQPTDPVQMLKQILSLSHKEISKIFKTIITSHLPHFSKLPSLIFSEMFQMYSKAVRWSSMAADLLGLTLQMLDWKSLLSVSAVSKYYHLQVWKPNNWKNIKIVRKGVVQLCGKFYRSVGNSFCLVRSLHFENYHLSGQGIIKFVSSMTQLRNLSLISFAPISPRLIETLIRSAPCLEILELEKYRHPSYTGFTNETLEAMQPKTNVKYIHQYFTIFICVSCIAFII
jgi:hypothetical protein